MESGIPAWISSPRISASMRTALSVPTTRRGSFMFTGLVAQPTTNARNAEAMTNRCTGSLLFRHRLPPNRLVGCSVAGLPGAFLQHCATGEAPGNPAATGGPPVGTQQPGGWEAQNDPLI